MQIYALSIFYNNKKFNSNCGCSFLHCVFVYIQVFFFFFFLIHNKNYTLF